MYSGPRTSARSGSRAGATEPAMDRLARSVEYSTGQSESQYRLSVWSGPGGNRPHPGAGVQQRAVLEVAGLWREPPSVSFLATVMHLNIKTYC